MIKIMEQFVNSSKGQAVELFSRSSGLALVAEEKVHMSSGYRFPLFFSPIRPYAPQGRNHVELFTLITLASAISPDTQSTHNKHSGGKKEQGRSTASNMAETVFWVNGKDINSNNT